MDKKDLHYIDKMKNGFDELAKAQWLQNFEECFIVNATLGKISQGMKKVATWFKRLYSKGLIEMSEY